MKKCIYPCFALLLIIFSIKIVAQPGAGKTLDFNGTSTYVDCGPVNLSGSQITMQAWVNVDAFKTNFPYITSIMGTENPGSAQALLRLGDASLANDKLQFVLYDGSSFHKLDGVSSLSSGKWNHVAATYDGTAMKLYINGILDASLANTAPIVSNDDFFIGRNYGNDRIMDGEIDEVSTWSTALSQATIRDWMCKKITPAHPNYANLTGYWPLNEGSGTTTEDKSTNAANGTFVGTPQWQNSGAPIGDVSKHTYATTYSLGLSHPQGDSIHFLHTSGSVEAAHVYRIDSVPYVTNAPSPLQFIDTSHYWGIFVVGSSNYAAGYYYDGNTVISNNSDCNIGFSSRANGAASSWTFFTPTSINYGLELASWTGNSTKEFTMGISSNGPHSFSYTPTEPTCTGDADGQMSVTVSGGTTPYSYVWTTGSLTSTATSLAKGYHTVTVTDGHGCISIDSSFLMEPDSVGAFVNPTNPTCALNDDGAILVTPFGGSTLGYTYQWNDPNSSTTSTVTDLYPGTYTVTVSDGNGCSATKTIELTSAGIDPIPDLGPDTAICKGSSLQLAASIQNGPIATYVWSNNKTTTTINISAAGSYSVTVTHVSGCAGIDSINISEITPTPVNLGPNITATGTHQLNAGGGFDAYQWNTSSTAQKINVTNSGDYAVTVTDTNGCMTSDTINVTIFPTGIRNQFVSSGFTVWPNPAENILNLRAETSILSVSLFDITGREVLKYEKVGKDIVQINISGIEPGKYFVRINSNERVSTQPLVKR